MLVNNQTRKKPIKPEVNMKHKSLIFSFLFTALTAANAQTALTDKIPVDPKIKVGKLANGLTYYIKKNSKPEKKVELRLVVNAGSILEDNDQQGLAHFTEHMAFNGTTHFKKNELVSFLQSIGVQFGSDLNAYTSFNETVYILPIPLSDSGNFKKGLQVLQDWAAGLTFDNSEIDAERKVVLEESRLGKGANDRMFRKSYPIQYAGSKYADRLPIGKDSILKTFKYDAVKRFYKDWYRPELMAVVAVGDIDVVATEQLIKAYFSTLKNPANPKKRIAYTLPDRLKNEAIVLTDPESTNSIVQFSYSPEITVPETTLSEYNKGLIKRLYSTLLNQRLTELAQSANPPYLFGGTGFGSYARGYESFSGGAVAGKKGPDTALQVVLTEVQRVNQFGFTANELERAKKQLLASIERSYNNRDKTESGQFADEFIRNFLDKESIPGIENEFNYQKELLPKITLEQVNALGKELKKKEHLFVSIQAPEKSKATLPTKEQLLAVTEKSLNSTVKAYEEKSIAQSLLKQTPAAGKIVSESTNNAMGTTEMVFSNGAKVILKPTKFKADEIILTGFRKGGYSTYGLADKFSASFASRLVQQLGIGDFSPVDLRKFLAGKTAAVNTNISQYITSVNGNSTIKDVETLFQLLYLNLTAPRKDEGLYNGWKDKQKTSVQFMMADPTTAFIDSVFSTLFKDQPLAPTNFPKAEDYDKVSMDRAIQIYKELTGDAQDFTFILTGNLDLEKLKPLLSTYIGGLPSKGKAGVIYDNGVREQKGIHEINFYKGAEQKSFIFNYYSGEIPYSESLKLKTEVLTEVLNIKIIEELREKIGGIYGGGILGGIEKFPISQYTLVLQLPCGPENVDKLIKAANEEIAKVKNNGPEQKDLDKVKKTMLEKFKVSSQENRYWGQVLQGMYLYGNSEDSILKYEQLLNDVTIEDIKNTAARLFDGKNEIRAVLYPEKK